LDVDFSKITAKCRGRIVHDETSLIRMQRRALRHEMASLLLAPVALKSLGRLISITLTGCMSDSPMTLKLTWANAHGAPQQAVTRNRVVLLRTKGLKVGWKTLGALSG
jgi:hypothetical protein